MKRNSTQRKVCLIARCLLAVFFIGTSICPPSCAQSLTLSGVEGLDLPAPGTMVPLSASYNPAVIKGITIDPDNPLKFDFIVEPGDGHLRGEELKKEADKLIKYFMASLTVPESEMWVNLSPYEKDRIIPESLSQTDLGRDLLGQDYILKQITASLMFPEDELGSGFWQRIYTKAMEEYGTTRIPVNTFNKVWIVPEKADVYVNGSSVFVVDSHLKVMLEEDYWARDEGLGESGLVKREAQTKSLRDTTYDSRDPISQDLVREILLPEIEREVNHGKNFAPLRQIYHSMILATWYKQNLRESLLGRVYADQNKINGIDLADKEVKQKIYDRYVEAFKKGVYDYIKEDYDPETREMVPRKYFSGGFAGDVIDNIVASSPMLPALSPEVMKFTMAASPISQTTSSPGAVESPKGSPARFLDTVSGNEILMTKFLDKGAAFDEIRQARLRPDGKPYSETTVRKELTMLMRLGILEARDKNYRFSNAMREVAGTNPAGGRDLIRTVIQQIKDIDFGKGARRIGVSGETRPLHRYEIAAGRVLDLLRQEVQVIIARAKDAGASVTLRDGKAYKLYGEHLTWDHPVVEFLRQYFQDHGFKASDFESDDGTNGKRRIFRHKESGIRLFRYDISNESPDLYDEFINLKIPITTPIFLDIKDKNYLYAVDLTQWGYQTITSYSRSIHFNDWSNDVKTSVIEAVQTSFGKIQTRAGMKHFGRWDIHGDNILIKIDPGKDKVNDVKVIDYYEGEFLPYKGSVLQKLESGEKDFSGDSLELIDLRGKDLKGLNFRKARFFYVILAEADLREAGLHKANFSEVDLAGADFTDSDLTGATMDHVKITADTKLRMARTENLVIKEDEEEKELVSGYFEKRPGRTASLNEISEATGLSRETVMKIVREWVEDNYAQWVGGKVRILSLSPARHPADLTGINPEEVIWEEERDPPILDAI